MPCCGNGRSSLGHGPTSTDHARREPQESIAFVYTGRSVLNVVGGATRRLYRFEGSGATLAVDRRDAAGLSTVPDLRRA